MKNKLDSIVDFVNSKINTKEKFVFNEQKYRGRYQEENDLRKSTSLSNENDRRMTRSFEIVQKTKQI